MSKNTPDSGCGVALTERLEPRTLLADPQITNLNDDGPGSLRQAMLDANASAGADRPFFLVPAGSVFRPRSPLPVLTGPTTFRDDAPSSGGPPRFEIDGSDAGPTADGLVFAEGAGGSVVDGFAINGFGGSGIVTSARRTSVFDGLTLLRCNIGTDQTGTMPRGNGGGAPGSAGVKVLPGANLVIGKTGDTPDVPPGPIPGGTISRNFGDGVQINPGAGAVLNGVIVDDNAGFGVIVNGPDSAVTVTGPESPFYPNRLTSEIFRNVRGGIFLGPGTHNSYVKAATIGDNSGSGGVRIQDSPGNKILSANIRDGVTMEGAAAAQNFVQACNIGGDRFGVGLFAGAHDNFFGGLSTNIRNPATPSLIGGRDAGVILSGAGTSHNTFIDVRIGGGAGDGVEISDGASSNVFRTMLDVEATTISGNGGSGVVISGAGSLHNSFDRVPIFGNRGIAIDLVTPPDGLPGLNPNDPLDADNGANTLLNHPVIASAVRGADGVTTIRGSIDTAPNITVELQFFADEMPLTGDFGPGGPQAARPLGKVRVGTDATGHAEFSTTVVPSTGNPGLQPGQFVIALASIAMDNFGDASELSPAVRVDAAPQVAQIYVNGSGWAQRFRDYLVRSRIGSASYGLALTPDFFTQPPTEVSWVNVDEIGVRFTEDVRIKREDVIVQGERLNGYGVDLHYDPTTFTATLRLSRTIPFDRITVQLDAGPTGVAARDDGAALDGDADGAPGGTFSRIFNVVPADVVQNGRVNAIDLSAIRRSLNADVDAEFQPGAPVYDYRIDLDGSGRIDALDLTAARRAMADQPATAAVASITAAVLGRRRAE